MSKLYSLRRLFRNTFEDHEGRPGKVGGSLPRSGNGSPYERARQEAMMREHEKNIGRAFKENPDLTEIGTNPSSKYDTPRKVTNYLANITGKGFSKQIGGNYLVGTAPENKMKSIEKGLMDIGFEKYKDDMKQDFVTSYRSGNVKVHMHTFVAMGNKKTIHISVVQDSGGKLPFVPYD